MDDSRVQKLIANGEFKTAAALLLSRPRLTIADRIAAARVELEVGDTKRAQDAAEALLSEPLERGERAQCLDVAGRAAARLGDIGNGIARLRKAISLTAANHQKLTAEFVANYVRALLNWVGVEPALAELPFLHRTALTSGNRRALVEYHLTLARIAAIRNWWVRAEDERQTASRLLQAEPCLDQMWRLHHVWSTICAKSFELDEAQLRAEQAMAFADLTGSRSFKASTLGNLAHLAAISGDFRKAKEHVTDTLSLLSPRSAIRFALYSTQIDVGLASNDTQYAAKAIEAGESLIGALSSEPSYYRLWFELHRVRWLVSRGQFELAAEYATMALHAVERLADTNLMFQMRALAAESLIRLGRWESGQEFFGLETGRAIEPSLETVAESSRLAGALAIAENRVGDAARYLADAHRVLSAAGLHGLLFDVERIRSSAPPSRSCPPAGQNQVAILESTALALQLGKHPRVLGYQVISVLEALGATVSASVVTDHAPTATRGEMVFSLGTRQGQNYTLLVVPRSCDPMLWVAVDQIIRAARDRALRALGSDDAAPISTPGSVSSELGMVVAAREMHDLVATTRRLAASTISVLFTGETGTGKELLARGLHDASPRRDAPFIPFNCSAVARDMLDAQLFGYRRGAFTGALEAFGGVIRAANGGTLFLDEVGEIGFEVQPKLLRFLESGEIHPLGEPRPLQVDVRVVAATNADLERLVSEGRFREDLFYRLNVVRVLVPPLRERREEVPALVHHFLDRFTRDWQKPGLRVADETMEYLVLYRWPGNVRQLANEVRRLVALAEPGAVLRPEHLSPALRIPAIPSPPAGRDVAVRLDQPLAAAIEQVERALLEHALKETGGRLEHAAQLLGLSRKGLYLKRQRLGLGDPAAPSGADPDSGLTTPPEI